MKVKIVGEIAFVLFLSVIIGSTWIGKSDQELKLESLWIERPNATNFSVFPMIVYVFLNFWMSPRGIIWLVIVTDGN